jgi:hypothetical protein
VCRASLSQDPDCLLSCPSQLWSLLGLTPVLRLAPQPAGRPQPLPEWTHAGLRIRKLLFTATALHSSLLSQCQRFSPVTFLASFLSNHLAQLFIQRQTEERNATPSHEFKVNATKPPWVSFYLGGFSSQCLDSCLSPNFLSKLLLASTSHRKSQKL